MVNKIIIALASAIAWLFAMFALGAAFGLGWRMVSLGWRIAQ